MLRNETQPRQRQVIGRIWSAIGIKLDGFDDETVEEMMAEWLEQVGPLSLDEIGKRVDHWKARPDTCPANEFAGGFMKTLERSAKTDVAKRELQKMRDFINGEPCMTKREAYDFLGLPRRWGPLPREAA